MILNSISLKDFRNFAKKEIFFSESSNLIVGPNASGKTNILEAIYLLATGKSFRVKGVESEMISYEKEIGRVRGEIGPSFAPMSIGASAGKEIGERGEPTSLEIILTTGEIGGEKTGKKKYIVNGVAKRAVDFVGNLRAVYFGPEDLQIITDSPSLRRKYLDLVLSQVDREYYRALLSYEKGLRARNKLLEIAKETGEIDRRRFYFWDQLLIKNGNIITDKRREFIDFLNAHGGSPRGFTPRGFGVRQLADGGFEVEYDLSAISAERLTQYDKEEVAAGMTLVGPHRDDFKLKIRERGEIREIKERDLSTYGSRGEQRLSILWLKLGELSYIKEKTGDVPVLLLDDIFSELDLEHRKLVFGVVKNQQTIVTTADLGMVEKKWLEGVKIIELLEVN